MSGDVRELSAVDTVYPSADEALVVESGSVVVFAQETNGRRTPVATVDAGDVVVGCAPVGDVRLLVAGLSGARIRRASVGDVDEALLMGWVRGISRLIAHRAWPTRLIEVDEAKSMVSPGEHIASAHGEQTWVQVSRGSAIWCGNPGAELTAESPPLVLTAEAWLTAGLRCRVTAVHPPKTPQEWGEVLDGVGRLALRGVLWRRFDRDRGAPETMRLRAEQSQQATEEAVDILAAAVGGTHRVPVLTDVERSEELQVAVRLAQAYGFRLDDHDVQRAAIDVEAGQDPLQAIASACMARPNPVTLPDLWWEREGNPMMVRVKQRRRAGGQPAAVVRRGSRWELYDATSGQGRPVDAELGELIDAHALEMMRVLPGESVTLRSLSRLAFHGSRRELAVIGGLTVVLAAMAFITPYVLGQLSTVLVSQRPTAAFAALFGALLLVAVAGTAFQALRAMSMLRARSAAAAVSATALWERVMRQRANWHARYSLGDRLNQASAVNNASAAMPDETVARILDVSFVLGSLAAIATTNSTMLAALAGLLGLQAAVTLILLRMAAIRSQRRLAASSAASTMLMETFSAVNRLRVAGAESRAYVRWARVQAPFVRADQALRRVTMFQGVTIAVWPLLTLVVVVAVTATTAAGFGEFVTAQTAATAASAAISAMASAASAAVVAGQSLRQAEPALESVPEGGLDGLAPGIISGGIETRELVFRYTDDGPAVLDHVSLAVSPGEHLAIVGPSGSGKTTLMRVLLGLEDPASGVIAVDGKDLASMNRPAVRRQIGSVLQSSSLLPGSIKDNVDMGRGLTIDQIWQALEAAGLDDDVRAMAMGVETIVTDGAGTISGGAAAAGTHRAGARGQPSHADPRRGDQRAGQRDPSRCGGVVGTTADHPNRGGAPAVDHSRCRPHRGHGARQGRRSGYVRRTGVEAWDLPGDGGASERVGEVGVGGGVLGPPRGHPSVLCREPRVRATVWLEAPTGHLRSPRANLGTRKERSSLSYHEARVEIPQ